MLARVLLYLSAYCFVSITTASGPRPSWDDIQNPLAEDRRGPFLGAPHAASPDDHRFTLRHVFHHGAHRYPRLHRRLDVDAQVRDDLRSNDETSGHVGPFFARSRREQVQRLRDRRPVTVESLLRTARLYGDVVALSPSAWAIDDLPGPNVSDKGSVLTLARMAANAYDFPPNTGNWEDVKGGYNYSNSFGWESDGLRGHIFADETNSTIVMALKGTSGAVYDSGGTEINDKVNDNLFFSCCCGQGGNYLWRQVCDCSTAMYTCNQTCLVKELRDENRYYRAALNLYSNVTELYPESNVWLTGHSLGGSVTALLGLTYGLPAVTFEAPPEALAASRLGLPAPPGSHPAAPQTRNNTGAYHFGHTADPVYMGICNGATSLCTLAGYAMESQCHTGRECIYDTVQDKGWRVGIGSHRMHHVINDVLEPYENVPKCSPNTECVDCFNWKYFESNGSDTTTTTRRSSTTSTSRRRTSTCKTPGWWGCLDESTTTTISTPITTTLTTTTVSTTCLTPGWFGCKNASTSTVIRTTTMTTNSPISTIVTTPPETSPSSSSSVSLSTSCISRGWWGCKNETTTTIAATSTRAKAASVPNMATTTPRQTNVDPSGPMLSSTSCVSRGWFGQCNDLTTTTRSWPDSERLGPSLADEEL